jgi:hypothetical protein
MSEMQSPSEVGGDAVPGNSRVRFLVGALLVLAGAALWVFVVQPLLGPSERTWDAQIHQDSISLTQLLRYDFQVDDSATIDAAWEKRRQLYDAEHLDSLRWRLRAFVDFQVAEYGDARDIYQSGRRPETISTVASNAQTKLLQAFPADAPTMIEQYRERVREVAYKASPVVGGEVDPDLPKFDGIYQDVVANWLPKARAKVESLTEDRAASSHLKR